MFIGPSEGTIDIVGLNDSQPVPVIPLAHHRAEHGRGEFPIANQHHPLHQLHLLPSRLQYFYGFLLIDQV
jgi:hypothetical protein